MSNCGKRYTEEQWQEMIAAYLGGDSLVNAASIHGASSAAILQQIRSRGIEHRRILTRGLRFPKTCLGCKKEFEVLPSKHQQQKFCSKPCRKLSRTEIGQDGITRRWCAGCGELVPLDGFYQHKSNRRSAYSTECKPCANKRSVSKARTPEGKAWRKKNNLTSTARYVSGRNGAKRRDIEWRLSREEHAQLIQMPCHYCWSPLSPSGCGLDRKNQERYYGVDSVVPCCHQCNSTFMDFYTYEEKLRLAVVIREINESRSQVSRTS